MSNSLNKSISAKPFKRFFVEMLTRDISLDDAILDLLDNCVDGIQRMRDAADIQNTAQPYQGFWAKISFTKDSFTIEDNCGGIAWENIDNAIRMGRPPEADNTTNTTPTIGYYGIGMKRAIFKMGNTALIETRHGDTSYQVNISEDWMKDEKDWELSVESLRNDIFDGQSGTRITIGSLHEEVQIKFKEDAGKEYTSTLLEKINSYYAFIISKGFHIEVNGSSPTPYLLDFLFNITNSDKPTIQPYIFQAEKDGIDVFLAVGLREAIRTEEELDKEREGNSYSSDYAGWTVICNERIVLYCDRSELTGWGTGGVPKYHTQFISISGIVEFRGDPKKLPTTTTKRGIDIGNLLYQKTLDKMRGGVVKFTQFTNKWKSHEQEVKQQISKVTGISYLRLRSDIENKKTTLQFHPTKDGKQSQPNKLPMPPDERIDARITFNRPKAEIDTLAEYLLPDITEIADKDIPSKVGIASFQYAYEQYVTNNSSKS